MARLTEAAAVLRNPARRRQYDEERTSRLGDNSSSRISDDQQSRDSPPRATNSERSQQEAAREGSPPAGASSARRERARRSAEKGGGEPIRYYVKPEGDGFVAYQAKSHRLLARADTIEGLEAALIRIYADAEATIPPREVLRRAFARLPRRPAIVGAAALLIGIVLCGFAVHAATQPTVSALTSDPPLSIGLTQVVSLPAGGTLRVPASYHDVTAQAMAGNSSSDLDAPAGVSRAWGIAAGNTITEEVFVTDAVNQFGKEDVGIGYARDSLRHMLEQIGRRTGGNMLMSPLTEYRIADHRGAFGTLSYTGRDGSLYRWAVSAFVTDSYIRYVYVIQADVNMATFDQFARGVVTSIRV
jgi:hypothetical protein